MTRTWSEAAGVGRGHGWNRSCHSRRWMCVQPAHRPAPLSPPSPATRMCRIVAFAGPCYVSKCSKIKKVGWSCLIINFNGLKIWARRDIVTVTSHRMQLFFNVNMNFNEFCKFLTDEILALCIAQHDPSPRLSTIYWGNLQDDCWKEKTASNLTTRLWL